MASFKLTSLILTIISHQVVAECETTACVNNKNLIKDDTSLLQATSQLKASAKAKRSFKKAVPDPGNPFQDPQYDRQCNTEPLKFTGVFQVGRKSSWTDCAWQEIDLKASEAMEEDAKSTMGTTLPQYEPFLAKEGALAWSRWMYFMGLDLSSLENSGRLPDVHKGGACREWMSCFKNMATFCFPDPDDKAYAFDASKPGDEYKKDGVKAYDMWMCLANTFKGSFLPAGANIDVEQCSVHCFADEFQYCTKTYVGSLEDLAEFSDEDRKTHVADTIWRCFLRDREDLQGIQDRVAEHIETEEDKAWCLKEYGNENCEE